MCVCVCAYLCTCGYVGVYVGVWCVHVCTCVTLGACVCRFGDFSTQSVFQIFKMEQTNDTTLHLQLTSPDVQNLPML